MSNGASELQQFHEFVADHLARGGRPFTPEECLDAWRAQHPAPDEAADCLAAIEEGLAQSRHGEGQNLDEFVRQFRQARGIPDAAE